jgi:hypothetical protein
MILEIIVGISVLLNIIFYVVIDLQHKKIKERLIIENEFSFKIVDLVDAVEKRVRRLEDDEQQSNPNRDLQDDS